MTAIALAADERAFLARRFACRNPERMRFRMLAAKHFACDGCRCRCGSSSLDCGSAQVQGELGLADSAGELPPETRARLTAFARECIANSGGDPDGGECAERAVDGKAKFVENNC